jgi:NTE family protein
MVRGRGPAGRTAAAAVLATVSGVSTSALVLGGGGVTGIAWEIGILAGLAEAGVGLSGADIVLGTSAGSVVGTLLARGEPLEELYAEQLEPPDAEIGGHFGWTTVLRMMPPMMLPGSGRVRRRRLGRAALRAHPESADQRVRVIRSRIGDPGWPDRDLRVTAGDATTGESKVFDRSSGVGLVEAVAASCAVPMVWPPVPIDGVPHMDGGMRSTTNADLVAGASRVVVLAPLPRSMTKAHAIPAQLERLGPDVRSAVATPDKESLAAIGRNMLDPARRAAAARSGRHQAADVVDEVRAVWGTDENCR